MVNGIGGSGAGRAAIEAALKEMRSKAQEMGAKPGSVEESNAVGEASKASFQSVLQEGIGTVEKGVERTNNLHVDVLNGRLDIHEVAASLKESEITFQFALQVRNKLMDAYREVMRMSV